MTKINKSIYLLASIVIIAAAIWALTNSVRKSPEKQAQNYQAIEGAKASSYEVADGVLDTKDTDMTIGLQQNAKLKIFVYEDYASPYSAQLADTLGQVETDHLSSMSESEVIIIARPFVVANSSLSKEAALAVMCAKELGKGNEMRKLVLAAAGAGSLQEGGFGIYANNLGIDTDAFTACLTNEEKSVKLDEAMAEATNYLVLGAPTMFVGDEMILGARPYSDFVDSNGDAIEGLKSLVERKLQSILKI